MSNRIEIVERASAGLTWWCVELTLTKHLRGRTEIIASRAWVGDEAKAKWLADLVNEAPHHPALKAMQWLSLAEVPSPAACASRAIELDGHIASVIPIRGREAEVQEVCS
ncbi:hypothetical protein [Gulosibacter macacae]|uniref:hypothetical protein n=1 Tax=Gulosibacter macacae TaxID=2488791 RepID=UPI001639F724|nr:hypothetical protein [Gulosibacter macacae]